MASHILARIAAACITEWYKSFELSYLFQL